MSSTLDEDEDDFVILNCTDPTTTGTSPETAYSSSAAAAAAAGISISTADISGWDMLSILLVAESSFFRALLGGSFSESGMHSVAVQWSLEAVLNILRFMYGHQLQITSSNCLSVIQAALYFGVETVLLECQTWLANDSNQMEFDDLIHVHDFALEHGIDSIQGQCVSYMAWNFVVEWLCQSDTECYDFIANPCISLFQMSVAASNTFFDTPYMLLFSCIKNPHLTVVSERHLCELLLAWISANGQRDELKNSIESDPSHILKQIRVSLLPLWFAAGKQKCDYFSGLAEESIDAISSLLNNPPRGIQKSIAGDDDLNYLRVRITKYSKKLDISSCPQITSGILFLSLLPSSHSLDPLLEEYARQALMDHQYLRSHLLKRPQSAFPTLSFDSVLEIDISKCPSMHLGAAIECFSMSFPSLTSLTASYLLGTEALGFLPILERCSSLRELNLTVDSSPIIPSEVSTLGTPAAIYVSRGPRAVLNSSSGFRSFVTKLLLEGRTDINDLDLIAISELCCSLGYLNIKCCYGVTDEGISHLLQKSTKLHSLIACNTKFGRSSISCLCSRFSNMRRFGEAPLDDTEKALHVDLQMLHIGGCNGVEEASLVELLTLAPMLKSLCLKQIALYGQALYSFSGSSLVSLDVTDTMVTCAALSHIVNKNSGLKCLKARGCKNLYGKGNTTDYIISRSSYPCEEYVVLGQSCKLEELTVGWGFSYFALDALRPAIMSLRSIAIGLGGSLGLHGLVLLASLCPELESITLLFQAISDAVIMRLMELRNLRELEISYCIGDLSRLSLSSNMRNLRRLKLERATPWMTNDDLTLLTHSCANVVEVSLIGCVHLDADAQKIISSGWPGLISLHLEDCGAITARGVGSLFDCVALESLLLRHTGQGLAKRFILEAASKLWMLRKISLDCCDAIEDTFQQPDLSNRCYLRIVKIARCKIPKQGFAIRRPLHKETFVQVIDSRAIHTAVTKERVTIEIVYISSSRPFYMSFSSSLCWV
ncbi:BTB/POZ domain-containing protein [Drosera capensis]